MEFYSLECLFMGWKNISGKWYYFEPAMVCGRVCEIYENETSDIYYFDDWIIYKHCAALLI